MLSAQPADETIGSSVLAATVPLRRPLSLQLPKANQSLRRPAGRFALTDEPEPLPPLDDEQCVSRHLLFVDTFSRVSAEPAVVAAPVVSDPLAVPASVAVSVSVVVDASVFNHRCGRRGLSPISVSVPVLSGLPNRPADPFPSAHPASAQLST